MVPDGSRSSPCTRPRAWSGSSWPYRTCAPACSPGRPGRPGSATPPSCRRCCAATGPTSRSCDCHRTVTRRTWPTRSTRTSRTSRPISWPRSADCSTWRSPGRSTPCCCPRTTGARAGCSPRGPGEFFTELAAAAPVPAGSLGRSRRNRARSTRSPPYPGSASWPVDPLGARRAAVAAGADLVHRAMDRLAGKLFDEPAASDPARLGPGRQRAAGRTRRRRRPAGGCRSAGHAVGLHPGGARPRSAGARPAGAPSGTGGAGTAGPPRDRVPRLAGAPVRRRGPSRARRAARFRRRRRGARRRPRPAHHAGS